MKTRQQKIDFIREACILANPSIKDLVFGCEIVGKSSERKFIVLLQSDDGSKLKVYSHDSDMFWCDKEEFQIIGRKIGIAEILFAVKKMNPELFHTHIHSVVLMWGLLLNDDLNLQSNETLAFLCDLLK